MRLALTLETPTAVEGFRLQTSGFSYDGAPMSRDHRLRVRPARPQDYAHFARLMPELATGDRVKEETTFLRELLPTTLIAEPGENGRVVGYAYYQVMKDVTYVRHIVTSPDARRGGVGRALMAAVAERARAASCAAWCLNVKPENAAAIALYEGFGMKRVHGARALRLDWSVVDEANAPTK
jgi:ribosomal protein S18 acetylase RimI-like enzyme